jgi:hypothetical protein
MTGYAVKRKKQYSKRILISLTEELYESLRSWARKRGLSVSAAIRLLIAEAIMREKLEKEGKRTMRE